MTIKKIGFGILFLCICWLPVVNAQQTDKHRAVEALQSLADKYRSFKSLHFSIAYRYAGEDRPGVYLDSLKGDFKMSGSSYRYTVDSTEYIGNKEVILIVFRQDRVLFLFRPSTLQTGNPMGLLDSLLLKNDNIQGMVEETPDQQRIILSFPPGAVTRKIVYTVDRKTGLAISMTNLIRSSQLYASSVRSRVDGGSSYVIVETSFSNYREGDFGQEELDPGRYFKKEGKDYVALPPYESYKIFKGTPDL
jgi:hypothetical protein